MDANARRPVTHVSVGNCVTPVCRQLPRRLLGVWAHPDDECYLSAGLMARVVAAGGDVRLVCATGGERGTDDAALAGTPRFAELRRRELEASLAVLGVTDVTVLGLPDGGCRDADAGAMSALVAEQVDAFGPDAIVTFGPDGITGHPDHLSVSTWTTAVAPSDVELLYATMTHDHVDRYRTLHDSLGLFADFSDGRPRAVALTSVALRCTLDHGELIRKRRALRRHGSQTAKLAELVGEDVYFGWWRDESFRHPTAVEISAARRACRRDRDLVGVRP